MEELDDLVVDWAYRFLTLLVEGNYPLNLVFNADEAANRKGNDGGKTVAEKGEHPQQLLFNDGYNTSIMMAISFLGTLLPSLAVGSCNGDNSQVLEMNFSANVPEDANVHKMPSDKVTAAELKSLTTSKGSVVTNVLAADYLVAMRRTSLKQDEVRCIQHEDLVMSTTLIADVGKSHKHNDFCGPLADSVIVEDGMAVTLAKYKALYQSQLSQSPQVPVSPPVNEHPRTSNPASTDAATASVVSGSADAVTSPKPRRGRPPKSAKVESADESSTHHVQLASTSVASDSSPSSHSSSSSTDNSTSIPNQSMPYSRDFSDDDKYDKDYPRFFVKDPRLRDLVDPANTKKIPKETKLKEIHELLKVVRTRITEQSAQEKIPERDIVPKMFSIRNSTAFFNEKITIWWLYNVIGKVPRKKGERILLLWDTYDAHMTPRIRYVCDELDIDLAYVPANCTPLCQPLDIGVNNRYKVVLYNLLKVWEYEAFLQRKDTKCKLSDEMFLLLAFRSLKQLKSQSIRNAQVHCFEVLSKRYTPPND